MKKVIMSLVGLLAACSLAIADGPEVIGPLTLTDISTGSYTQAVDEAVSESYESSWVEGIAVQMSGINTADIDIVTSTNTFFQERILWTVDNHTSTNICIYPLRDLTVTSSNGNATNEYTRYFLANEKWKLRAYAATATNSNIRAWLIRAIDR